MAMLASAGCKATESGAGCCGMAGSFGYEDEHYEISRTIGEERLFPTVNATDKGTIIAVAGVYCRQQIEHFTGRKTRHIAGVLAAWIEPGHVYRVREVEAISAEVELNVVAEAHAEQADEGAARDSLSSTGRTCVAGTKH
jgi:Fe-S oxidoreductase